MMLPNIFIWYVKYIISIILTEKAVTVTVACGSWEPPAEVRVGPKKLRLQPDNQRAQPPYNSLIIINVRRRIWLLNAK